MRGSTTGDRLIALFLLGVLLMSPPLLAIFNRDVLVLGVPLLFLYLFGAWLGLIVLLALILGRSREPPAPDGTQSDGG